MLYSRSTYQLLPQEPGIYLFLDKKGNVLYVGKAKNLRKRVSSYFISRKSQGPKTEILISQIKKIKTIATYSEIDALLLEAAVIKKYSPKYNVKLTDGKAYPLIRITVGDKYPKVLIARRKEDKRSLYFGPFPKAQSMRLVLKLSRRIFPFQGVKNHSKKICLYNHLGLCPCPPVFDSEEFRKEYEKNISYLIRFLSGNSKNLLKRLAKERDILAKREEFEKAKILQEKIDAIEIVTLSQQERFDQDIDVALFEDRAAKELEELKKCLVKNSVKIQKLERIECYDVSNIQGRFATGSMAVFIKGVRFPALYRKFRIKTLASKPNDFAMLSHVLRRRLKHLEWPYADLIIVDGGKGQVSSVVKVLKQGGAEIPIIGIAKKEEIIITSNFREIKLPKTSQSLKIVMRIRDESHRFAISYHKKLRSKEFLSN